MNLNENSHKTLSSLDGFEGVLKTEFKIDSKKIVVFDVGVDAKLGRRDSLNVGLLTARAAAGGLARVTSKNDSIEVVVKENVALATLGCQMAGWAISIDGENALASGPARILAKKPGSIFEKIKYGEKAINTALILESDKIPDLNACKYIMDKTNAKDAVIAVFRGNSNVGLINVLARVVELAVYRLDFLGYDVNNIASARGSVKVPRDVDMCKANDALIYNSSVELEVNNWDESLTEKCVSKSSKFYGKKFREIYEKAGCNFYRIDESIFAPARIKIKELKTAKAYQAGNF